VLLYWQSVRKNLQVHQLRKLERFESSGEKTKGAQSASYGRTCCLKQTRLKLQMDHSGASSIYNMHVLSLDEEEESAHGNNKK
jgi:hypothetical protein